VREFDDFLFFFDEMNLNLFFLVIYSNLYEAFYTPLKRETILLAQGVD